MMLRPSSLPYLLTMQLKRFDFDLKTMSRFKIHDRMTFPFYLDMNDLVVPEVRFPSFHLFCFVSSAISICCCSVFVRLFLTQVVDAAASSASSTSAAAAPAAAVSSSPASSVLTQTAAAASSSSSLASPSSSSRSLGSDSLIAPTKERPFTYELFSVLVHSGSALGGHYFSYEKVRFDSIRFLCCLSSLDLFVLLIACLSLVLLRLCHAFLFFLS